MFSNMLVSFKQRFKQTKKKKQLSSTTPLGEPQRWTFYYQRGKQLGEVIGVEGKEEEETDKILCV